MLFDNKFLVLFAVLRYNFLIRAYASRGQIQAFGAQWTW